MGRPASCLCGECKKCKRATYMREHYRANAERGREIAAASYARNIETIRARDRARGFRETDKMKIQARNAARKLGKGTHPCEVCGSIPADAHHHDYSKPLEVSWLCETHHGEIHRTF